MKYARRLGLVLALVYATEAVVTAQTAAPATAPASTPGRGPAQVFPKLPADQPSPRLRVGSTPGETTPDTGWMRRHDGLVELAKKGGIEVYFEGDSITDFWSNPSSRGPSAGKSVWDYYYAPIKAANFGISADNIEHVLYRVMNGEFDGVHPKVVVLLIGTNNFGHAATTTPEEVAGGVKHLVEVMHEKSPETKVLVLGIFPRGASASDPYRAKLKAANELLAKLDNGSTTRFLDIGEKFLAPDGSLPRDVMPDYLHPNAKGYRIWAEAMNPALFGMLGLRVPAAMAEPAGTAPAR